MRLELEYYEPPSDHMVTLGRFMDDFIHVARSGTPRQKKHILELGLVYLPALANKDMDTLKGHLADCEVWRWLGDIPVFRTRGEPCVFFTVVKYENLSETGIHALGAALSLSEEGMGKAEDAWEERIVARCRSLGLV